MRHHSIEVESVLAGETSHSTDQPEGKAVKTANISLKVSPENNTTSKAEYANTQQGLPVNGYNLVHLIRHAKLFWLEGFVCRKSN